METMRVQEPVSGRSPACASMTTTPGRRWVQPASVAPPVRYRSAETLPIERIRLVRKRSISAAFLSIFLLSPVFSDAAGLSPDQIREISQVASAALEANHL